MSQPQTEKDMVYYLEAVAEVDKMMREVARLSPSDRLRKVCINALRRERAEIRAEYEDRHNTKIAEV